MKSVVRSALRPGRAFRCPVSPTGVLRLVAHTALRQRVLLLCFLAVWGVLLSSCASFGEDIPYNAASRDPEAKDAAIAAIVQHLHCPAPTGACKALADTQVNLYTQQYHDQTTAEFKNVKLNGITPLSPTNGVDYHKRLTLTYLLRIYKSGAPSPYTPGQSACEVTQRSPIDGFVATC